MEVFFIHILKVINTLTSMYFIPFTYTKKNLTTSSSLFKGNFSYSVLHFLVPIFPCVPPTLFFILWCQFFLRKVYWDHNFGLKCLADVHKVFPPNVVMQLLRHVCFSTHSEEKIYIYISGKIYREIHGHRRGQRQGSPPLTPFNSPVAV